MTQGPIQVAITIEDENVNVQYLACEHLSLEQLANSMAILMNDTLGEEPQMGDVLQFQRMMMEALKEPSA